MWYGNFTPGITVDKQGNFVVADSINYYIQMLTSDRNFIAEIGFNPITQRQCLQCQKHGGLEGRSFCVNLTKFSVGVFGKHGFGAVDSVNLWV